MEEISKIRINSGNTYGIKDSTSRDRITILENSSSMLESRITNIVSNSGDSNTEIKDARLDSDGVTHSTLGDHIRNKESNIYSSLETLTSRTAIYFTSEDDGVYVHYVS